MRQDENEKEKALNEVLFDAAESIERLCEKKVTAAVLTYATEGGGECTLVVWSNRDKTAALDYKSKLLAIQSMLQNSIKYLAGVKVVSSDEDN